VRKHFAKVLDIGLAFQSALPFTLLLGLISDKSEELIRSRNILEARVLFGYSGFVRFLCSRMLHLSSPRELPSSSLLRALLSWPLDVVELCRDIPIISQRLPILVVSLLIGPISWV
jgi:hypothetical protein